jgi:UDP-glucose 4-epimerase
MATALVTGGAGFIGSHVADRLIERGARVVVFDDLSGGFRRNVPAAAEFRQGSIADPKAVDALFDEFGFRWVFHLAAYAAEGLSPFVRRFNYETNLLGSVHLINASVNHDVECFVYTSSIAVYGSAGPPFREDQPPRPEDPYGIAKWAVEQDLRAAGDRFGLPSVVFRPHNVYGPRQNLSDPYRNVIGIFLAQARAGRPCTIFGDGSQVRAFTEISDVAPLIARSVDVPAARGETFNIGADRECTILELAREVQRAVGREVGVEHLPPRDEVHRAVSDHAKLRRVFGGESEVSLAEGIGRMARWAETVEPAPPRTIGELEIERGLPPSWRPFTRRGS